MAERSVVVRLRAEVASYIAGLNQARTATAQLGKEIKGQSKSASADIERIGTASVIAGGAITLALGKGLATTASFEKQLSNVRAVSGATADEMGRLEDAALAAGASQKLAGVTASDAAAAEAELVKAGVSVSDTLGGALMGSLTLASAGQLEFADAASIAAQSMNIFDLSGRDVTHIADLLAAASNKSAGDVAGFGDALRQGGLVAKQTGLTLEETVGALAAFADNALIGSDAGTSLKTMLQRLTPQSAEAAELMEQLGFSAYDAKGNFIGLDGLAGELQSSLAGLTNEQRNSAMATLFGSDAVRGANVLYEQGAAGIREYIAAVDDEGAAARMAAIQNDNLKGDLEALGGALESVLIENGSKATGVLRGLTQGTTDMVESFSNLPDLAQTAALGLGGMVGAASLLTGGFVTLAPKIEASTDALKKMDSGIAKFAGNNLGKISGGLAGVGLALSAGMVLYSQATEASRRYKQEVDDLATALGPVTEGQSDLNSELENFLKAQQEGLSSGQIAGLNALGVTMDDIQGSIRRGADALDPLRESVERLGIDLKGVDLGALNEEDLNSEAVRSFAAATGMSYDAVISLIDQLENWDDAAQESARRSVEAAVANDTFTQSAVDAAVEANTASGAGTNWAGVLADLAPKVEGTGDAAGTSAGQIGDMAGGMDDAEQAAKDLKEAIDRLMEPLDTRSALDQFSSGINDMASTFADADAEVSDAQENMRDRQRDLNELLAMPADERGDNWAERVQDAKDAITDAQARIDDAVANTSRTLDGNSEAALRNRDMLDQLARDGVAAVEAMAADETLTMEERMYMRGLLIQQMETEAGRLGLNKEQVGFYTEALKNIPLGDLDTNVHLTGVERALADAEAIRLAYQGLLAMDMGASADAAQMEKFLGGRRTSTTGQRAGQHGGLVPAGLAPVYRAAGGPVGTDTVQAWLTPGEYVMRRSAVDRFGVGLLDAMNRGSSSYASMVGTGSASKQVHLHGDIHNHYPAPEPVGVSMPRVARKAAALMG